MKITFKDVGQGDSIIFEWISNGVAKVGIIDCCMYDKKNPVKEHLAAAGYKEIEFVILSHPHTDHYSGLLELLEYAEANGVKIKLVAHTLFADTVTYWKYFEVNRSDSRLLKKIISKFKELRETGVIDIIDVLVKGATIRFCEKYVLECLAPTHDEIELYQERVKLNADLNPKAASSAANLLSTIFRFEIDNSYFLFTSDAEIEAFQTILARNQYTFAGDRYILCQIPHHGSEANLLHAFWEKIEVTETHAAISAGEHKKYNHPSFSVIKHFHDKGYTVNCTNIVNGMENYRDMLKKAAAASLVLETFGSSLATAYSESNDRSYLFADNMLTLLENI